MPDHEVVWRQSTDRLRQVTQRETAGEGEGEGEGGREGGRRGLGESQTREIESVDGWGGRASYLPHSLDSGHLAERCSGFEAGSYLQLKDVGSTQL